MTPPRIALIVLSIAFALAVTFAAITTSKQLASHRPVMSQHAG